MGNNLASSERLITFYRLVSFRLEDSGIFRNKMVETEKRETEVLFRDDPAENGIRYSAWNYLTILEYFSQFRSAIADYDDDDF